MIQKKDGFLLREWIFYSIVTVITFMICITFGSVTIPWGDTWNVIINIFLRGGATGEVANSILVDVRIPRVLCVAMTGAALALTGAAMQGLLRNSLADGSTIGVSSGASLGAVLSIAFGITLPIPIFSDMGTVFFTILFSFLSMLFILTLAYRLDFTLSTNTIILIGVIFSMFAGSIISFIVTFAGDKVKNIMFWTMGSLSGTDYKDALLLGITLLIFGTVIFSKTREINAFAIGEENARNIGVNVRRVKMAILIAVSALIGVAVSIGGTIAFVGLVIPHMSRMVVGANHKRLLPATLFAGAVFLMFADLFCRVVLSPIELPIGVVTSFLGSIVFIFIFFSARKKG